MKQRHPPSKNIPYYRFASVKISAQRVASFLVFHSGKFTIHVNQMFENVFGHMVYWKQVESA